MIYGDHIFQLADNAVLVALDKHTGHMFWSRKLGALSASSPAVNANTVYATVLSSGSASPGARVRAQLHRPGDPLVRATSRAGASPRPCSTADASSSARRSGTVYALDARSGNVVWTYHAGGSVKASPTLARRAALLRRLLGPRAGDLRAAPAGGVWVSGSEGALLGSGTFYSTAAVIYGRVFLGNTDGRMYAYDADSGKLDWAMQTGAYVYSSPAVTNAPGLGPTVYIGLLRRHLLCHQRPHRARQLELPRGRAHLGLGHDHRPHRLLRRPRRHAHVRPRHLHRPRVLRNEHRRLRPGDQRQRTRLPDRLHLAVRARAEVARPLDPPRRARGLAVARASSSLPRPQRARTQEPPAPSARASEKRASTRARPAPRSCTSVQPPGALPTHPAAPVSVQ